MAIANPVGGPLDALDTVGVVAPRVARDERIGDEHSTGSGTGTAAKIAATNRESSSRATRRLASDQVGDAAPAQEYRCSGRPVVP